MSTIKVSRKDLYGGSSEYESDSDSEGRIASYSYVPDFEIEEIEVDQTTDSMIEEGNSNITSKNSSATTAAVQEEPEEEAYAFNLFSSTPAVSTEATHPDTMEIDSDGNKNNNNNNSEDKIRMIRLDTPDPDEYYVPTVRPDDYYTHKPTAEQLAQYEQAAVKGEDIWANFNIVTPTFGTFKGKVLDFNQMVEAAKKEKRGLGRPGAKRRKSLKEAKANKPKSKGSSSAVMANGERYYGPSRIYGNDFFKDVNEKNFGNNFRGASRGGRGRGSLRGARGGNRGSGRGGRGGSRGGSRGVKE